jgi:hypothetical protein
MIHHGAGNDGAIPCGAAHPNGTFGFIQNARAGMNPRALISSPSGALPQRMVSARRSLPSAVVFRRGRASYPRAMIYHGSAAMTRPSLALPPPTPCGTILKSGLAAGWGIIPSPLCPPIRTMTVIDRDCESSTSYSRSVGIFFLEASFAGHSPTRALPHILGAEADELLYSIDGSSPGRFPSPHGITASYRREG